MRLVTASSSRCARACTSGYNAIARKNDDNEATSCSEESQLSTASAHGTKNHAHAFTTRCVRLHQSAERSEARYVLTSICKPRAGPDRVSFPARLAQQVRDEARRRRAARLPGGVNTSPRTHSRALTAAACAAANGASRISRASARHTAALRRKPAPGTHAGTYFTAGTVSARVCRVEGRGTYASGGGRRGTHQGARPPPCPRARPLRR